MSLQKHHYGKTYISRSYPWGLHPRNGHRLLCSDGKIRAAELAETADTFFSVPASVRINGKHISGFASTVENDNGPVYVFHAHTLHGLPDFPTGEGREAMIKNAQ